MFINYPADKPYQKDLIQHIADPLGKQIYQNDDKNWYFADSNAHSLRPIQPGRCYAFNGTCKVSYNTTGGGSSELIGISNVKTVAFWIGNITASLTRYAFFEDGSFGFALRHVNAAWQIWGGTVTSWVSLGTIFDNIINDGQWHYVTCVLAGVTCSVYIDATLIIDVTLDLTSWTPSPYDTIDLGHRNGGAILLGSIAYVLLSKTIATAYDINKIMHLDFSTITPVILWNCDEGAGTTTYNTFKESFAYNATINLAGADESIFHITNNQIQSIQNVRGFTNEKITIGDIAAGYYSNSSVTQVYLPFPSGNLWGVNNTLNGVYNGYTAGRVYTDEYGIFLTFVNAVRIEYGGVLNIVGTDRSFGFRVRCRSSADVNPYITDSSFYNWMTDYKNTKGLTSTAPTVINTYYQDVNTPQLDKDEIDNEINSRRVDLSSWTWNNYYAALPGTWLTLTSDTPYRATIYASAKTTTQDGSIQYDYYWSDYQRVTSGRGIQLRSLNIFYLDGNTNSLQLYQLDFYSNAKIPRNQNYTYDVLGTQLLTNYIGQVRYDTLIKGSSVGNFDGVLYGSIPWTNDINKEFYEFKCIFTPNSLGRSDIFSTSDSLYDFSFILRLESDGDLVALIDRDGTNGNKDSNPFKCVVGITYEVQVLVIKNLVGSLWTRMWIDDVLMDEDIGIYGAQNILLGDIPINFGRHSTTTLNPFDGMVHYFEYNEVDENGNFISNLFKYNFSETAGLTVFNTAKDRPANSDMSWILNGSADGTQWSVSDLQYPKNLSEGFNKAGYIPATTGGVRIGKTLTLPNEFKIKIKWSKNAINYMLRWTGATTMELISAFFVARSNVAESIVISGAGGYNLADYIGKDVEIRKTAVGIELYADDVLKTSAAWTPTGFIEFDHLYATQALTGAAETYIYYHRFYDINDILLYDFNPDNKWIDEPHNVIPTIIKMDFPLVPADPANAALDIIGNTLTNTGNNTLNDSENSFNRNYADAPNLNNANISSTENITYDDIIADNTRFYDTNQNSILDALVYSEFPEPMTGSIINFNDILFAKASTGLTGLSLNSSFHIKIRIYITTLSAGNQFFFMLGGDNAGVFGVGFRVESDGVIRAIYSNVTLFTNTYLVAGNWYDLEFRWGNVRINGIWESYTSTGSIVKNGDNIFIATKETSSTERLNGKMQYFEYYTNYGNTTPDIKYVFSEENGLILFDISGDNRNMIINLNGSADGTQWIQGGNTMFQHNLKYGYGKGGVFNLGSGNIAFFSGFDGHWKAVFSLPAQANYSQILQIFYLGVGVGLDNGFILRKGTSDTAIQLVYTISQGTSSTSTFTIPYSIYDNNIHTFEFLANGEFYLDNTLFTTYSSYSNFNWDDPTGIVNLLLGAGSGICYNYHMYGTSDEELVNLAFYDGNELIVPNIGISTPDMNWNTESEYQIVPGDPNNPGKDVLNNNISNMSQVNAYRKINNFIRRD